MIAYYKDKYYYDTLPLISSSSLGFQYGYGFFTTMKYSKGKIHFFNEHISRLNHSSREYGLSKTDMDYKKISLDMMEKQSVSTGKIKIIVFSNRNREAETLITAEKYKEDFHRRRLTVCKEKRGESRIFKHKSLSYLNLYYKKHEAVQKGFDDYLYIDHYENVLETSIANIFFIKDKLIFTPSSELPFLEGIIRNYLLSLKTIKGYTICEKDIKLNEIQCFNSAFITNSLMEMQPVVSIDDNHYRLDSAQDIISKVIDL